VILFNTDNNDITSVNSLIGAFMDIIEKIQFAKENPHITILDLRKNHYSDLPNSLAGLTHIDTLLLSLNEFSYIPDVIFQMSWLRVLDLSSNALKEVNAAILGLSQLEDLDLGYWFGKRNCISQLPDELGQLHKLRRLSIQENPIHRLPDSIVNLSQLEMLNLIDTSEHFEFSKSIAMLTSLKELNMPPIALTGDIIAILNQLPELSTLTVESVDDLDSAKQALSHISHITL